MADMEEDKDVSRRYRELPPEEPPPSLDARIRAEARSALETHAAPLVPPTGRGRWYFPVAAAAVIMLAVAVTWQIDREQPDMMLKSEVSTEGAKQPAVEPQPKTEEAKPTPSQKPQKPAQAESLQKRRLEIAPSAAAPEAPAEPRAFSEQPKDQPSTGERSRDQFSRDNRERQERPSSPPAASPPASQVAGAEARRADSGVAAGALSAGGPYFQTPEAWLFHIQALRQAGSDDEADKQLEAFRKRYPDYKIPPETLKKVERAPR